MPLDLNSLPTEARELTDAELEAVAAGKRRSYTESGPQYNPASGTVTNTRSASARGLGARRFVNRAV